MVIMYVGIEFEELDGGGVSLVNAKWFTPRKSEVWWPPTKSQDRFNKALRKGESPENDWKIFKIKRCFFHEGKTFNSIILQEATLHIIKKTNNKQPLF